MLRKAGPLAVLILSGLLAAGGRAQQQAPKTLEDSGTIKGVSDSEIQIETTKNSEIWLIQLVGGETKLRVEGTAEPSYLRGGLTVKFTGEFDKKGALSEDIKELEIFTPQGKNDLGLFAGGSEKPVRNASPGSYEIHGKVTSFKDNEIVVAAGTKKISGKVAEGVAIKVNVEDTKEVRAGDAAKVKATYLDPQKPYGMKPGTAIGNEVEVTLSKPLTGVKKKTTPKPAKPPKEKKEKEKKPAGEAADGGSLDLFGVDKGGKDDAKEEMSDDEKPKSKKPTKKPAKEPDDE